MPAFWLLVASTTMLAVVTFLPIWQYEAWWVRGQDFPRLQYAAIAIVLGIAQALTLDPEAGTTWLLLSATVACLAYQAWWILPYTALARREVEPARRGEGVDGLRVMSVNVMMSNRRAEDLLRIVGSAKPDVIIALETDLWWESQLERLRPGYPHVMRCPLDNRYGMHLFSRFELRDGELQFLVEPRIPSMHASLVLPSGRCVRLHCLHPQPPSPTENPDSQPRDAELVAVAKSVAESEIDTPVIVAGDLNDVAWSATTRLFRKISGLLDPRVGRGMFNTFHADYPFLRWPLDHLFHSEHFGVVEIRRLPAFGSDHFPILVELAIVPGIEKRQHSLQADAEDRRLAAEAMAEQGVGAGDVHAPEASGRPPG